MMDVSWPRIFGTQQRREEEEDVGSDEEEEEIEEEVTTMTLLRGAAMCHIDEFDYLKQGAMLSLVLLAGWLG